MDYRIPQNRRSIVMFGIFTFIVAALSLLGAGLNVYWQKSQAQAWTKVQGEVLSTSIETEQHKNSTIYIPKITYRYQVGVLEYFGRSIRFGLPESGIGATGLAQAKQVLDAYPVGATPFVFVDPMNPRNAVLDIKEVSRSEITGIIAGSILAVLGAIAFIVLWRERNEVVDRA